MVPHVHVSCGTSHMRTSLPGIVAELGTTSESPRKVLVLNSCLSNEEFLLNLNTLVSKLNFLLWNGNQKEAESVSNF